MFKLFIYGGPPVKRMLSGLLLVLSGGVFAQNALSPAASSKPVALPMPALGSLAQSNPFDPDRKVWPEHVPPPPPPPVPAPVTEDDLSVYGVVMAGGVRKALLKLGKRFGSVPVGPTGLASVHVGGQLGEFVLAQVTPDQILLSAPGGQQWVRIGNKKDRAGSSAAARAAAPQLGAGPTTPGIASYAQATPFAQPVVGNDPAAATNTQAAANPPGAPALMGVPGAPVGAGSGAGAPVAAPAGSLAAAIAAAQANQANQPGSSGGSAAVVNPFEALLQQQRK